MLRKLAKAVVLTTVAVLVVQSLPDLARWLRLRNL